MPIILEDSNPSSNQSTAVKINYGPKDYNSILTGNGINQGLLRSNLYTFGSDNVSTHVITTLEQAYVSGLQTKIWIGLDRSCRVSMSMTV